MLSIDVLIDQLISWGKGLGFSLLGVEHLSFFVLMAPVE